MTPDLPAVEGYDECDSYLLDDDLDISAIELFLKDNFDKFFQEQLYGV